MTDRITYPVNAIYPAIQGEGTMTGTPMVLLRLQGCSVGCTFCDTKETWELDLTHRIEHLTSTLTDVPGPEWVQESPIEIASLMRAKFPRLHWVLLTGGEPAQYGLSYLVTALHKKGFEVALETSGTAGGHIGAKCDWVTVSPKAQLPLIPEVLSGADELKFVIGKESDLDDAMDLLVAMDVDDAEDADEADYEKLADQIVCLQPMSQNKKATTLCVDACLRYGWRLSVQIHKYIGVR